MTKSLLCPSRLTGARPFLYAALGGAVAMAFVQTGSVWLVGNDSYYHVKMAQLLPELGLADRFPWLRWTILHDQFVSHHHGFHVLLLPFVFLSKWITGDLVLGGKAATILAMGLTAAMFHSLLRVLRVGHPLLWTLALACLPWHFWLRMSYVRAPIIGLPMLLAAAWCVLKERPKTLGLLAFAFTHVYGGAVVLPLVPGAFVLARFLSGQSWLGSARHLAAVLLGMTAGLVINPYYPENLEFLRTQLFETGLGAPKDAGIEWRAYDAWFFLKMSFPLLLIWVASLAACLRSGAPRDARSAALLLLNVAFLVLAIKARRFVEYWPVFALLNAADMGSRSPQAVALENQAFTPMPGLRKRLKLGFATLACLTCGAATLLVTRSAVKPAYDPDALAGPMDYLACHSPAGSLVFTDDWDTFPYCFYLNHHNHYVVGLDPVFTHARYPDLWERYRLITRGRTPATLENVQADTDAQSVSLDDIGSAFHADYVLVAADHPKFYRQLRRDRDRFRCVYPTDVPDGPKRQPPFSVFEVAQRTAGANASEQSSRQEERRKPEKVIPGLSSLGV